MAFLEAEDIYGSVEAILFPKVYERFKDELRRNAAVKIVGRVSVKENGDVDIICDSIVPLKKGSVSDLNAKVAEENTKGKYKSGLYLRVPSMNDARYIKARNVMDVFDGRMPVIIKETDTGKAFVSPESKSVMMNGTMLRVLKEILGEENVKYVE